MRTEKKEKEEKKIWLTLLAKGLETTIWESGFHTAIDCHCVCVPTGLSATSVSWLGQTLSTACFLPPPDTACILRYNAEFSLMFQLLANHYRIHPGNCLSFIYSDFFITQHLFTYLLYSGIYMNVPINIIWVWLLCLILTENTHSHCLQGLLAAFTSFLETHWCGYISWYQLNTVFSHITAEPISYIWCV